MLQAKSRRRSYAIGGRLAALGLHRDRHFHFASEQEAGLTSKPIDKGGDDAHRNRRLPSGNSKVQAVMAGDLWHAAIL